MRVILLSVAALAVFSVASAIIVEDPNEQKSCESEEEEEDFYCLGEKMAKSSLYKKSKDECLAQKIKDIQDDKKDRQKGITCLVLCEWQKYGIIDTNGKFIEAKTEEMLKSLNFTAPLTKKIKDGSTECYKKYESKLTLDPKDKKCSSYRDLVLCYIESFMKTCEVKYDAEDWAL